MVDYRVWLEFYHGDHGGHREENSRRNRVYNFLGILRVLRGFNSLYFKGINFQTGRGSAHDPVQDKLRFFQGADAVHHEIAVPMDVDGGFSGDDYQDIESLHQDDPRI